MRVLVAAAGNNWFAQGLELDIAAQGKTLLELQERFVRTYDANVALYQEENRSLNDLGKAHQRYLSAYENGSDLTTWESLVNQETFVVKIVPNLDCLAYSYIRLID